MKHVLSVYVENQPGVLVRVASMFSYLSALLNRLNFPE